MRCGIVTRVTEWPATIDRRYHDAVILDLRCVVVETAAGSFESRASTIPLARRLRDAGIETAVYSSTGDCADTLRAAGLHDLVGLVVEGPERPDAAALTETAARLGTRPVRCVVVDCDPTAIAAARDGGFCLVIGLERNGHGDQMRRCGADAVVAALAGISVRTGDTPMSAVADALRVYSQLKELVASRRPAVFLDFDGTLSEIVEQPDAATLVPGAAEALRALAAQCPVAVISGRDLGDVRARVNVDGLWYAGSHGFELLAPDGTHHQKDAAAGLVDMLAGAAGQIAETLGDIPGVAVEHKRFAVAIHYRNADPRDVDRVVAETHKLGRSNGLRVTTGRKVIELRPDIACDKGTTVNRLLGYIDGDDSAELGAVLPLYIGDDITDEDAFDEIQIDGAGIVVRHDEDGDRPSAALFSLESPLRRSGIPRSARQGPTGEQDAVGRPVGTCLRGLRPRLRAAAGGAVHRRQRLRRHPRLRAGGPGVRGALPGHLRRGHLQHAVRPGGRADHRERKPGEPAQLAVADIPDRRRAVV